MQGWGEVFGGLAIAIALAVGVHASTERDSMNRLWYQATQRRVEVERELREENAALRAEVAELRGYANEINRALTVMWFAAPQRQRTQQSAPPLPMPER